NDAPVNSQSATTPTHWQRFGPFITARNCTVTSATQQLFHRHALGQIARLVDVAAAGDGGVVGDELERDHAQERLERFERVGDFNDVVAVAADVGVAFGGHRDDLPAA